MKSKKIKEIWPALFCNKWETVTQNQTKCNATISLPKSIKNIIRVPNGGLILVILGAQEVKIKIFFVKKKSKLSHKWKSILSKLFWKVLYSSWYNCSKRIKKNGYLMMGSLKGSEWVK